jgi:hypothetical protein
MSNDHDDSLVWVSDLDDYVDIRAIPDEGMEEEEAIALNDLLDELGEFPLFSGKSISARALNDRGISPDKWLWAKHEAEHALHEQFDWSRIELLLVKDLLSLGRRYAVARYAKWESISYHAALTATFPHGFRALLDQFLDGQKGFESIEQRRSIHSSLQRVSSADGLTAYHRTGILQLAIHKSANDAFAYLCLEKNAMRNILSLARLHYSVCEIGGLNLLGLRCLEQSYKNARIETMRQIDHRSPIGRRHIQNWTLRHHHPLTYLYPYAIRHAIARGIADREAKFEPTNRSIAVNELALAHCGIWLMRQTAKSSAGYL